MGQRNTLLILVVFLLAQVAFQNLQSTKTTTAMGGAASGIPGRIQTKAATTTTAAAAVIMNDKDKDDIAEQVVSKLTQQFWNPNNNANATAAAASTVVTARGHEFDDEIRALLSHVLVIIVAWWDPSDMVFLGHTLGTIRDWNVQDLMGAVGKNKTKRRNGKKEQMLRSSSNQDSFYSAQVVWISRRQESSEP